MTDQEQRPDFGGQFVPQPPSQSDKPAPSESPPKEGRRQRGGRRCVAAKPARKPRAKAPAATKSAPVAAAPAKRTRRSTAARATRIDLALAVDAFAGLSEPAAALVARVAQMLNAESSKTRHAVLHALRKLFP